MNENMEQSKFQRKTFQRRNMKDLTLGSNEAIPQVLTVPIKDRELSLDGIDNSEKSDGSYKLNTNCGNFSLRRNFKSSLTLDISASDLKNRVTYAGIILYLRSMILLTPHHLEARLLVHHLLLPQMKKFLILTNPYYKQGLTKNKLIK